MEKLVELKDPAGMQSGIFRDLAPGQTGLWKESANVDFTDGAVEKTAGWGQILIAAETVRAIDQTFVQGEKRIYYGTDTRLEKVVGGVNTTLGTGYTATLNWSLVPFGTWLIAANGIDPAKVWKNTGAAADLAGTPLNFKIMHKSNNHILGYSEQTLYFSSKSDPETWTASPTNSAGELPIRDMDSDVMGVLDLGNSVAVYSADTMLRQEYVDAPSYFGFAAQRLNGIGLVGRKAGVNAVNANFGLSTKGFWKTDGGSYDYIDNPMVNRWFKANYDPTLGETVVCLHIERKTVIRWIFTCLDTVRRGLDYNYKTNAWSIHTIPLTAGAEQQVFDYPIIGDGDRLGFLGNNTDRGSAILASSLKTFPFDAGVNDRYKTWQKITCDKVSAGTFEFRVGYYNKIGEAPIYSAWAVVEQTNWLNNQNSVYIELEFRTTLISSSWRIGTLTIWGDIGGML